jgi:hypothetical protein
MRKPRPPQHLQPATRSWWASVARDYQLEPHHYRLLTLAAQSWDRGEQARELLARDGLRLWTIAATSARTRRCRSRRTRASPSRG